MAKTGTFAIQFDVTEDGTCIPVNWSGDHFTNDEKITIVLEEYNNVVWIYYGKRNGLVKKRKALRQAESLRGHGYQVGKTIIGRQLQDIKEIDARMIERVPEATAAWNELQKLFKMPAKVFDGECVSIGESGGAPAPRPAAPAPAPAPRPAPAAAPAPASAATQLFTGPKIPEVGEYGGMNESFEISHEVKLVGKASMSKQDETKAGTLLIALLREFSDIYVSVKGNHFKIESLEGRICDFTIEEGTIKFSKDSFAGMDPGLKKKIQATFVELMN